LELPTSSSDSPSIACECGAGIGRVTKGLLLDFCDRSDLVESSERLLHAAPEYIGNKSGSCRFFCSELQVWEPPPRKYTIIWIQWVGIYLTDIDLVKFLQRCGESLVDGGVIVLKENTCADETFVLDVDDASLTRSHPYWLDLICKAGLRVISQTWQEDFPDDIFPVPMLALQPASKLVKDSNAS
jgi:protein N-terminal methyltransferase